MKQETTKVEVLKPHKGLKKGETYELSGGALEFRLSKGLVKIPETKTKPKSKK
jgi:hypothetical protein